MKKVLFLMSMLLASLCAMAQSVEPTEAGEMVINVGTFTGIVALVSSLVTQLVKKFAVLGNGKWAKLIKIGLSAGIGIVTCMVLWLFDLSPLLDGYVWWEALLYGLVAGLSGCGFYDLIKAIWQLLKPKDDGTVE